ncbi:DUF5709 domain-containing protein [Streptomyces eurythermus]
MRPVRLRPGTDGAGVSPEEAAMHLIPDSETH